MVTDDTFIDTTPDTPSERPGPDSTRRSRRLITVALVAFSVAASVVGVRAIADLGDASPADAGGNDDGVVDVAAALPDDGEAVDLEAPAEVPDLDPAPDPPEGGEAKELDPDPEGEGESADPCPALPDGRALVVTPRPVVPPPGQFASELIITNCSDEPVAWSATTLAPSVTLGVDAGVLAAGADVDLQFAVDEGALVGTGMAFTITVTEPGFATDVMVQVFKVVLNPQLPQLPDPGLQPAG